MSAGLPRMGLLPGPPPAVYIALDAQTAQLVAAALIDPNPRTAHRIEQALRGTLRLGLRKVRLPRRPQLTVHPATAPESRSNSDGQVQEQAAPAAVGETS